MDERDLVVKVEVTDEMRQWMDRFLQLVGDDGLITPAECDHLEKTGDLTERDGRRLIAAVRALRARASEQHRQINDLKAEMFDLRKRYGDVPGCHSPARYPYTLGDHPCTITPEQVEACREDKKCGACGGHGLALFGEAATAAAYRLKHLITVPVVAGGRGTLFSLPCHNCRGTGIAGDEYGKSKKGCEVKVPNVPSGGVVAGAAQMMGFDFIADPFVPAGTLEARSGGVAKGRVTGMTEKDGEASVLGVPGDFADARCADRGWRLANGHVPHCLCSNRPPELRF